jgi:hypothetical protein
MCKKIPMSERKPLTDKERAERALDDQLDNVVRGCIAKGVSPDFIKERLNYILAGRIADQKYGAYVASLKQ